MPITIRSNIASLENQRALSDNTDALKGVLERLSSGQRINRAGDDAAGLAISEILNVDARVYSQAVRNVNDGISALAIADSAVESLTGIVVRLQELASQSANGSLSNTQRKALDEEAQALSQEYLRIAQSAEFNGQGLLDGGFETLQIQAGYGTTGGVSSDLGGKLGTGTFSPSSLSYTYSSGVYWAVTHGDVNGDGHVDIVAAGYYDSGSTDGYVTINLGRGDGTFEASAASYATEGWCSVEVALEDINLDGEADLITAGRDEVSGRAVATVRLGNGDGTFGSAVSYSVNTDASTGGLDIEDLNGDGLPDMVHSGSGRSHVRLNLGNGVFSETVTTYESTLSLLADMCVEDLNGDGRPDLIQAGRNGALDGYVSIRLAQEDGTFGSPTNYSTEARISIALAIGDVNGDGYLDLVTAGYDDGNVGYATVRLGHGDGTFASSSVSYATELGGSNDVVLFDQNGDGFVDLITAGYGGDNNGYATIRLNNGDGTFGAAVSYASDTRTSKGVTMADVNEDGVADLVTAGRPDAWAGSITIRAGETRAGVQPLLPFDLSSMYGARQALPQFRRALESLVLQRSTLGAFESRLATTANNLLTSGENFRAAASRIRDADIAEESSRLLRLQILQNASAAVQVQANQQPALLLKMLSG